MERASELCAAAGAWLVLDNTYEHFVYDGREHFCMAGPHILNIFSFSKVRAAPAIVVPGIALLYSVCSRSKRSSCIYMRREIDVQGRLTPQRCTCHGPS